MEALRNYTQHRGFPIHTLSYNGERVSDEGRNRVRLGVSIHVSRSELAEDPKFKKSVLSELESHADSIDLKPLIRDYVADLATVHEWVKEVTATHIATWESRYRSAINRFSDAFPDEPSLKGLTAVAISDAQQAGEVHLFTDFVEYRSALAKKNSGAALKRLGTIYVSGEATDA